jgi:hypothetical protein
MAPLALGLTASILSAMVTMGVERFIQRPLLELLWLVAALLVALEALGPRRELDPTAQRTDRGDYDRSPVSS